jgi:hypothetical protein
MHKPFFGFVATLAFMTGCGTPPPPVEYPATVLSKHYQEPDTKLVYAPWFPTKFVRRNVPEKFIVDFRYCEPRNPAECKEASTQVTKDLYDSLHPDSQVIYTEGMIQLP